MDTDDIVVAGCGIGGLEAALRLERKLDEPVTVVEPRSNLVFWPSIHRVLGGAALDRATINLETKFSGRNIRHVQDHVTGLDPSDQVLDTGGNRLQYDTLVLALGSTTTSHEISGIAEHALDIKQEDDLDALTTAASDGTGRIVVVGGGATGVETAGFLNAHHDVVVTLLESDDRLLHHLPEQVGIIAEQELERDGVDVRTGVRVDRFESDGVTLTDGTHMDAEAAVWAGGVQPNPVIDSFPLPQTADGITVNERMQVAGHDSIYAVGDVAHYPGKANRAFFALAEAKTAYRDIVRRRIGKTPAVIDIGWEPTIISLAPRNAVFSLGGFTWSGIIPAVMRSIGVEYRYTVTRKHLL